MNENTNIEKIKYYNSGIVYRPDTVSFGTMPDGGISMYCYTEMPCPPEETMMIKDENGAVIRTEDIYPDCNHVRVMQCGVQLTPEETNELILSLMTVDNGALVLLRNWLKKISSQKRRKILGEFEATIRYLFPEEIKAGQPKSIPKTLSDIPMDSEEEEASPKTLRGEDLNRYLDLLNHRKRSNPVDKTAGIEQK